MERIIAVLVSLIVSACDPVAAQTPETCPAKGAAWTMHTIHSGLLGADGVHLVDINGDGLLDVTSGWEQSSVVTVSLHPGFAASESAWPTVTVGSNSSVEDAKFGDVDGDGAIDVVAAGEGQRVTIHFAPTDPADLLTAGEWTSVTVDAATNVNRWMQVALADVDGDTNLDLVIGGRVTPAVVAWFDSPTPRTASSWTKHDITEVGQTMSLFALDVDGDEDIDIVLSDRLAIDGSSALKGSRWVEQTDPDTWVKHAIGSLGGEPQFISLVDLDDDNDLDVVECASNGTTQNLLATRLNTAGDFSTWSLDLTIQKPSSVGNFCHGTAIGDLNGDSTLDLVVDYAYTEQTSGIIWLDAFSTRGEISGSMADGKFDNPVLYDVNGDGYLDVVDSEQNSQLGIVWYEHPNCSPAAAAAQVRSFRQRLRSLMRRGSR